MKYGLMSGVLWALDTVILGIATGMSPYIGTAEAIAFAAIVSSAFHDAFCAIWMFFYMLIRGRLGETWAAAKTRNGRVVMAGALLGGPIGMTGYVLAINHVGPGIAAIVSSFYPAFGALLAVLVLKERMNWKQYVALIVAMLAIVWMGASTASMEVPGNAMVGILGALMCVVGWGSEAVLCAWGMRGDGVDDEVALQIRETTSGLVYLAFVLPVFGAWGFAASVLPSLASGVVALAAFAGTASYLFYYKGIARIGAAKAMAANISYSAWAVVFGVLLLGHIPGVTEIICCVLILVGTVLASCNWEELFSRKQAA